MIAHTFATWPDVVFGLGLISITCLFFWAPTR